MFGDTTLVSTIDVCAFVHPQLSTQVCAADPGLGSFVRKHLHLHANLCKARHGEIKPLGIAESLGGGKLSRAILGSWAQLQPKRKHKEPLNESCSAGCSDALAQFG